MNHANLIVLAPFFGLLIGMFAGSYFFTSREYECPSFIRKTLPEAMIEAKNLKISFKIVETMYDPSLKKGYIVKQVPMAGQKIKTGQTIFLTIVEKNSSNRMPLLLNLTEQDAQSVMQKIGCHLDSYYVPQHNKNGTVIAQFPSSAEKIKSETKPFVYIGQNIEKLTILPSFIGYCAKDITDMLHLHGLPHQLEPTYYTGNDTIIHQEPLAYSILDLTYIKMIYLHCNSKNSRGNS